MKLERVVEGRGPVVVLLHGFPLNRAMWDAQREGLRDTFRVIVPDLRGMGASGGAAGEASMDLLADDVIELLDAEKVEGPFVLGGLSMGGYVALSIVERSAARLRGLMLLDTRAGADSPEAAQNRRALADRVEAAGSVDEVIASFLPKVLGKTTHAERPALVERVRQMMGATAPAGAAACLRGMASRPDRTAVLAKLDRPALVLVGEEDALTTPDESREMAEALPQGQLEIIAGAGHLTCLENSQATTEAIKRFLEKLA